MKKYTTADRLKQIMQERDLKQVDILQLCQPYCKKFGEKLDKSHLSLYVSGQATPNQRKLSILSLALGVSEVWLMGYDIESEKTEAATSQPPKQGIKIPVLGDVAAGVPIAAIEDVLDYEEIDADMASRGEYFGLRIKGASMEPRMTTGDVVIVRCQPTVDSGDTAVVLVNGDSATVKKVKITKDGILLIPTNPSFEPMFYTRQEIQDLPVVLLGQVVELRAKF